MKCLIAEARIVFDWQHMCRLPFFLSGNNYVQFITLSHKQSTFLFDFVYSCFVLVLFQSWRNDNEMNLSLILVWLGQLVLYGQLCFFFFLSFFFVAYLLVNLFVCLLYVCLFLGHWLISETPMNSNGTLLLCVCVCVLCGVFWVAIFFLGGRGGGFCSSLRRVDNTIETLGLFLFRTYFVIAFWELVLLGTVFTSKHFWFVCCLSTRAAFCFLGVRLSTCLSECLCSTWICIHPCCLS